LAPFNVLPQNTMVGSYQILFISREDKAAEDAYYALSYATGDDVVYADKLLIHMFYTSSKASEYITTLEEGNARCLT